MHLYQHSSYNATDCIHINNTVHRANAIPVRVSSQRYQRAYNRRVEPLNLISVSCVPLTPMIKPCKAITFSLWNVRSLNNKAAQVNEYIVDNKIDIMALTETWLSSDDVNGPVIAEATPRGYTLRHVPRGGRGGGVGIKFKTSLKLKINTPKKFMSFEYMDMTLKSVTKVLRVILLYWPPPSKANKLSCDTFFSEFTALLEFLMPEQGCAELLIAGDFNFHVDDQNNMDAMKFLQILHSFNFTQHVNVATHKKNHTLDLIITRTGDKLVNKLRVQNPQLSDHFSVSCKLMITKPSFAK